MSWRANASWTRGYLHGRFERLLSAYAEKGRRFPKGNGAWIVKRITLSSNMGYQSVFAALQQVQASEYDDERIIVDWRYNRWMDPTGLTLLAAHLVTARRRYGADIEFENFDPSCYPARMGIKLLCGLEDDYPMRRRPGADRFVEMRQIRRASDHPDYAAEISEILRLEGVGPQLSEYSLTEMLGNVHAHAFSPCNAIVACQHYPGLDENGTTIYAVADTGNGIISNVRGVDATLSDEEAMWKAMEPRFTTSVRERHSGLGLPISAAIAVNSGGSFRVLSDDVMLHLEAGERNAYRVPRWPGTLVIGVIPAGTELQLADLVNEVFTRREAYNGG